MHPQKRRRFAPALLWVALGAAGVALGIVWWVQLGARRESAVPVSVEESRAFAYAGLPLSTRPGASVEVLHNKGFVVGYSETRRNPLWAAYRLYGHSQWQPAERPSRFRLDPRTRAHVSHDDFTNSGYDRGHLAPNWGIATRYGRAAQLDTFLLTNICPQDPDLNRGPWLDLERLIAGEYAGRFEEVWVIAGPVFDEEVRRLASAVEIPEAFYKIVVDEDAGEVRALAFLLPQTVEGNEPLACFLTCVDDLERLTGLDFLAGLADEVEVRLEAATAEGLW